MHYLRHLVLLTTVSALALAACDSNTTEPDPPRPSTVRVEGPDSAMVGDTLDLQATVLDQNGQGMAGASVNWSSSAPAVAEVTASGEVYSLAEGAATITATAGGATDELDILIWAAPAPTAMEVEGPDSLMVGDTATLRATLTDQYGETMEDRPLVWSSSDSSVVTVDPAGHLEALAEGNATLSAAVGEVSDDLDLLIWAAPAPAAIEINGPDSLMVGDTATLRATLTDQYGETMEDRPLVWSSSDSSVVTVDSAGHLEAVAEGSAILSAAVGDVRGELSLGVRAHPAVELADRSITLTALGNTATISATVSGEPVNVQLSLLGETRWNDELAVAAFSGEAVTAVGAGAATYQVASESHPLSPPDTLLVRVEPETPYLLQIAGNAPVGPDSPLLLRGYNLTALASGSITAGGETAAVAPMDSATLRVTFDAIPQEVCIGARTVLEVTGADLLTEDVEFQRQRIGSIALEVGETRRLTADEAACIRAEGPDSARFALAYFDARYAYSRNQELPYQKGGADFSVTLADVSADGGAVSSAAPLPGSFTRSVGTPARQRGSRDADLSKTGSPPLSSSQADCGSWIPGREPCPWETRTMPFEVGDVLTEAPGCSGERINTQVVEVVDDYFVVTIPEDSVAGLDPEFLDTYLGEVQEFSTRHAPWVQDLFARPALTNGQYLIAVCPTTSNGGGAQLGFISVRVAVSIYHASWYRYYILAHEYAHSAEEANRREEIERVGHAPSEEKWWNEGVADMVGWRATGDYLGQSFTAELDHADVLDPVSHLAQGGFGALEEGYDGSAGFGFDLTWRVAEASGLTWEQAHDTVTFAMAHNRYGCSSTGCDSFEGLYEAMQRHLDPAWDPVEGVLTYVASHALDDLVESDVYRWPSVHRVSEYHYGGDEARPNLLGPQLEVLAYSGDTLTNEPVPIVGAESLVAGSTGWYRLIGGGGAFRATTDADEMEWMLIRLR